MVSIFECLILICSSLAHAPAMPQAAKNLPTAPQTGPAPSSSSRPTSPSCASDSSLPPRGTPLPSPAASVRPPAAASAAYYSASGSTCSVVHRKAAGHVCDRCRVRTCADRVGCHCASKIAMRAVVGEMLGWRLSRGGCAWVGATEAKTVDV